MKKTSQNYNIWVKPILYEIEDLNVYGADLFHEQIRLLMKFKGALAVKNMLQFIAVRVLNDLNHQPIFTHKDCSYICVFVVLLLTCKLITSPFAFLCT